MFICESPVSKLSLQVLRFYIDARTWYFVSLCVQWFSIIFRVIFLEELSIYLTNFWNLFKVHSFGKDLLIFSQVLGTLLIWTAGVHDFKIFGPHEWREFGWKSVLGLTSYSFPRIVPSASHQGIFPWVHGGSRSFIFTGEGCPFECDFCFLLPTFS